MGNFWKQVEFQRTLAVMDFYKESSINILLVSWIYHNQECLCSTNASIGLIQAFICPQYPEESDRYLHLDFFVVTHAVLNMYLQNLELIEEWLVRKATLRSKNSLKSRE